MTTTELAQEDLSELSSEVVASETCSVTVFCVLGDISPRTLRLRL